MHMCAFSQWRALKVNDTEADSWVEFTRNEYCTQTLVRAEEHAESENTNKRSEANKMFLQKYKQWPLPQQSKCGKCGEIAGHIIEKRNPLKKSIGFIVKVLLFLVASLWHLIAGDNCTELNWSASLRKCLSNASNSELNSHSSPGPMLIVIRCKMPSFVLFR